MASLGMSILKLAVFMVTLIIVTVLIRTFTFSTRSIEKNQCKKSDLDFIAADEDVIGRFQKALTFRTISTNPGDALIKPELQKELRKIKDFIFKAYTQIHSSPLVKYEVVADYSLLYTVEGSDKTLAPYLLMGHLDVVPVIQEQWNEPAFDGTIKDGFIYGRGTIDDKHTVFGILEALEFALKHGFKPKRSFYLAFGHDEEVRGSDGAKQIAKLLTERLDNSKLEFIMDEGLTIINNLFPGLRQPVALIGNTEKGSIHLKLSVNHTGGHSSMPEKDSCIGILASAINRLEETPQPNMFGTGSEKDTLEHLAPHMSFPLRVVMSNLWLFKPLVSRLMSLKPSTNAIVRTTTAITMFNAGIKDNVIPTEATAIVNHRVHPGHSIKEALEHDRQVINDERVQMEVLGFSEPHFISPSDEHSFGYHTIKTSVLQVWNHEDVVVTPGVMIGNTDTIHYLGLSNNVYRFSPTFMFPEDLKRFHGNNERLSIKNYEEAVNFFYHLINNADSADLEPLHEHGGEL